MKPLHPSARGRVPGLGARLVSLAGIVVTGLLLALWRIGAAVALTPEFLTIKARILSLLEEEVNQSLGLSPAAAG